tara:strand:+ start:49 stop:393 length:345 start_codon:yes stop_codon:yes gene_type:complete
MNIFIDIDDTICRTPINGDYGQSEVIQDRVNKVNSLYDEGHVIVFWTARGSGTGIDWTDITQRQLEAWGVKYHQLMFGKPVFDVFIDDKSINSDMFFGNFVTNEEQTEQPQGEE